MLSITKTTNMSGAITIGGRQAAFMSAVVKPDGKYDTNFAVQDVELIRNNKEEINKDRAEFENAVEEAAAEVTT